MTTARTGQERRERERETREEDATAAQHGPLSVGRPPASLHDAPRQGGSGRGPVRLLKIKQQATPWRAVEIRAVSVAWLPI